ncbi:MAG: hypothetical protein WAS05_09215 [Candidatus Nanopelagicales bacterium]
MSNRPERLRNVDQLDVEHLLAGHRLTGITSATKREAIVRMFERGDAVELICDMFGMSEHGVAKTLSRAGCYRKRVAA